MLTVASGSAYSILQKLQNKTQGAKGTFDHPYFQSFLTTIGEMMAFIVYYFKKRHESKNRLPLIHNPKNELGVNETADLNSEFQDGISHQNDDAITIDKRLFAIPAILDMTESVLKNIALTMIAASIVQMLRSTVFVYCALLALFFLKKKLYRHHLASMITIIGGVVLVGLAYYLNKKETNEYSSSDVLIGLILLQVGQLFGAFAFVSEEKFLGDCETLDPLLLVGYEGIAGFIIWMILLPAFQFIPCDAKSVCTNGVIEDSIGVFRDYAANPILILYSVGMVIVVSILNVSGVSVTKYGSSA